jgi:transposase
VTEQNLSVRKASKILKIKYTTAKALVQKYRISGNIDRQRARRMTFEDDQRERFRKDLIKKLPIEVEEESDDEIKWGTAAQNLQTASVLNGGMVTNSNVTSTVS